MVEYAGTLMVQTGSTEDPAVGFAVFVATLATVGGLYAWTRAQRVHRASADRESLARFLELYRGQYPESLLTEVHRYLSLRRAAGVPHRAVRPDDDLRGMYELVGLDLEDAVLLIADRAGARLPRARELDTLKGEVRRVEDLLRYLEPFFRPDPAKG
jgi:hypothetical protein